MSEDRTLERRTVQTSYAIVPKSMPVIVSTGSQRECHIANLSHIPYDYVPPPENIEMTTVPYKWPSDEEWSRMPNW